MTAINSANHKSVYAEEFEVLVDRAPVGGLPPAIALRVKPKFTTAPFGGEMQVRRGDEAFLLPMRYEAAFEVARLILTTLRAEAPSFF
jgi:hypothetical protein